MIPDKIYIHGENDIMGEVLSQRADGDIEYIRRNAFIDKALKWMTMKECIDCVLSVEMIDEFKKYMEE